MKKVYIVLTGICLLAAVVAFCGAVSMVYAGTHATLGGVTQEVLGSGNLKITGIAALIGLIAAGLGLWVRHRIAGLAAAIVLWLAGLAGMGAAAFQANVLLARIAKVSKNMGGLEFAVRAPGYADALLILSIGLAVGAASFAALAWIRQRARSDRDADKLA